MPDFQLDSGANVAFCRVPIRPNSGVIAPAIEIKEQRVYPVIVPDDLRAFSEAIWRRMVVGGETHTADEWRQLLAEQDRIGRKRNGQIAPMGEERFRWQIRELAYRMRLPLTSQAGEDKQFGLARNREECEKYADSLRSRLTQFRTAGRGLLAVLDDKQGWLAGEQDVKPCAGLSNVQIEGLLTALNTRPLTNEEMALVIGSGRQLEELSDHPLSDEQRALYRRLRGATMRDVIHQLRVQGIPVVANQTSGYWLAKDAKEIKVFLQRLHDRGEQIEKRIETVEAAARLWFPRDQSERAIRDADLASWQISPLWVEMSQETKQRLSKGRKARERRQAAADNEEEIFAKEQARRFRSEWINTPRYQSALQRSQDAQVSYGNSEPLSTADRELVRRMQNAMDYMKGKRRRRVRLGNTPMPWELPAKGEVGPAAIYQPSQPNASELLNRSEKRSENTADPVPW